MGVRLATVLRVQPGRDQELIELLRGINPIIEKHGGSNLRLMQSQVGTGAYSTYVNSSDWESLEAWAAGTTAFFADPDAAPLLAKGFGPDAPAVVESQNVLQDV